MICLQKSLRFLDIRVFILEMFNISPAAAQHCVLCKNRHDFVTKDFVQIFINIYYMQFIYRKMLTHMAVKWWIRLVCILRDIMNVPITKTHSPTYSQRDRERKKERKKEKEKERKRERKKVHSLPITGVFILCTSRHIGHNWWTGVQTFQYKHNFSFSLQHF